MGRILIVSLLAILTLTGCNSSPTVGNWSRENTSAEEANSDRIQCETENKSFTHNASFRADPVGEIDPSQTIDSMLIKEKQQVDLVGECMRAKGYSNY